MSDEQMDQPISNRPGDEKTTEGSEEQDQDDESTQTLDFSVIRGGMASDDFEQRRDTVRPKGYLSAAKRLWTEYYYDMMQSDPELYFNDDEDEIIKWLNAKNGTGSSSKYCFITVNFDNTKICQDDVQDVTSKLHKTIRKSVEKVFIEKACYNFEQRGTTMDTLGTGIHMNILIEKSSDYMSKKPSQIRDEFYKTFKKFVGNTQHVWIRYNTRDDQFLKYLEGWKKDETKEQTVLCDYIWRYKLDIEDVYEYTYEREWNFRFCPDDFTDQIEDPSPE